MASAAVLDASLSKPVPPARSALAACFLAGVCTYLNMYCTQPLLPFLQRIFHATEIEVSMTVSATILAVALTAPFIGLLAESIGRKKVIVPSLYALTPVTMLAATSQNLQELIFWRFMQGVFVPGVIVVIMAYIKEEFPRQHVGRAMSAYISGTVLGGFLGRYISGVVVASSFLARRVPRHRDRQPGWARSSCSNLCPSRSTLCAQPASHHSLSEGWQHLQQSAAAGGLSGWDFGAVCLVGAFTYANFYLARPPYRLNSEQLGSIFFVYLLGLIVTPLSGRCLDHYGVRLTSVAAVCFTSAGLLLTLLHSLPIIVAGLALASSGVFIYQAVGTVQTGIVADRSRSSAAGLYVTFYYIGGSLGAIVTGWTWIAGRLARMRVSVDGGCRARNGVGVREQQEDSRQLSAVSHVKFWCHPERQGSEKQDP